MKNWFYLVLLVTFGVVGCKGGGEAPKNLIENKPTAPAPEPEQPKSVLAVAGPGGTVELGDTLDKAKKAFPPPKGAQVFDKSLSFAIVGIDGWAWASETGKQAFEVAMRNGKIVDIAVTREGTPNVKELVDNIGKPTRQAKGKTASMMVWERGDDARFAILLSADSPMFGEGSMTIVGLKDDIKLLSYRADDPQSFVKMMDNGAEQLKSRK